MKLAKRSLALILAFICAFSALAVAASALVTVEFEEIGKDSVTIKKVNGTNVQYGWKAKGADGDFIWGDSNVITDINGSTEGYTFKVKNSIEESAEVDVLAAPAAPEKPEYESCTSATITVKAVDGYEYRCYNTELGYDSGWKSTNVLEGLRKDTLYSVTQRVKAADNQFIGEESEAIEVRTAHREMFTTKIDDCTVDIDYEGSVNAGETVSFTANGSAPIDKPYVDGDVRFIPYQWYAVQVVNNVEVNLCSPSTSFKKVSDNEVVKTTTFDTSVVKVEKKETAKVLIYVTFRKQVYNSKYGLWITQADKPEYLRYNDFPVGGGKSGLEKFTGFISTLINYASKGIQAIMAFIWKWLTQE